MFLRLNWRFGEYEDASVHSFLSADKATLSHARWDLEEPASSSNLPLKSDLKLFPKITFSKGALYWLFPQPQNRLL